MYPLARVPTLITTKVNYQAAHSGATFNRLYIPLEAYDPSISSDSIITDHMRDEREWTANLFCQRLLRAAKRGACTLILREVEDTWVRRLKNATNYYSKPPPPISHRPHRSEPQGGREHQRCGPPTGHEKLVEVRPTHARVRQLSLRRT